MRLQIAEHRQKEISKLSSSNLKKMSCDYAVDSSRHPFNFIELGLFMSQNITNYRKCKVSILKNLKVRSGHLLYTLV